ncbi:MAG: DUF6134 family protein [Pseudomonadota bacterium]
MINRRGFIACGAAALAAPSLVRASTAARTFRVLRDGSDIGFHRIAVTRSGADVQVAIDIELKVKFLGITAYRYEMANREIWRDGMMVSMDSKSNDDGAPAFSRVTAASGKLEVDGSVWSGVVDGDSASTTYWTKEFLNRKLWISTADGDPLKVDARPVGPSEVGGIATEKYSIGGDMAIDLHYAGDEWVSVRFDAGGEDAIYIPDGLSPAMAPVWTA